MEEIIIYIKKYFLIVVRVGFIFMFIPLFSYRAATNFIKIFITLIISFLIFWGIDNKIYYELYDNLLFLTLFFKEAFIGFLIGFVIQLPFVAMNIAGDMISFKTLFSIATILDPSQEQRSSIWAEIYIIFAVLIFLASGGFNLLLNAIFYSFKIFPITKLINLKTILINEIIKIISDIIFIGIAISMPVVISLLITNLSLGVISKSMMNFNVFFIGIPLQILLAIIIMIISIDINGIIIKNIFEYIFKKIDVIINTLRI